MESAEDSNAQNITVHGRKVYIMREGAAVCFLCERSFVSIKNLYHHICDHSDSEWKTYLALHNMIPINVGGNRKNLEAKKVDISKKKLFGWKVVKGKRGRPGLKVAKDGLKIGDKLKEAVEGPVLLAHGHREPSSKEVEPAKTKIQDLAANVGHDHKSMAEPIVARTQDNDFKGGCMVGGHGHDQSMAEPTIVPQTLIQAADADLNLKGGYMVVHDFDLNEEPLSTAMEDQD